MPEKNDKDIKSDAMTAWKKTKKYVQFSKKVIVGVNIGFGVICAWGMWLCGQAENSSSIVGIIQVVGLVALCDFAMYSGNSVFEKWFASHSSIGTVGSELQSAFTDISISEDK